MPIVRRRQQATAHLVQRRFLDAAALVGERAIILRAHHPFTDPRATRCSACWSPIYQQSTDPKDCPVCFGTTYDPPFKEVVVVRGIVQTPEEQTKEDRTGEYMPKSLNLQIEAYPQAYEGDFILRVDHWRDYQTPAKIGKRYRIATVRPNDLRVGTYQPPAESRIGQVLTMVEIPDSHVLYNYQPSLPLTVPPWPQP